MNRHFHRLARFVVIALAIAGLAVAIGVSPVMIVVLLTGRADIFAL